MNPVQERYQAVKQRIAAAAASAGRELSDIELIVITKNHPAELVADLIDLGHSQFGENRDQEAKPKAQRVQELRPNSDPTWHFVGQLQSNKVKSVLSYASTIHSLDRQSLLKELSKHLGNTGQGVSAFIELNLTEDPNRGGLDPASIVEFAEAATAVDGLEILGLMAVAGLDIDPRVDFERVQRHSLELQQVIPEAKMLSLGMSADFEAAIEFGATHLRIGSVITGPRAINT